MPRSDLQIGARGGDVRMLQQLVSEAQHATPGLDRDGSFGPLTDAAVRRFQQSRRLEVDGVAGPQTWTALMPATRHAKAHAASAPVVPPALPRPTPTAVAPGVGSSPTATGATSPTSLPASIVSKPKLLTRADTMNPAAEPKWFKIALAEFQLHHNTRHQGGGDNRIHEYFQSTSYRPNVGTNEAWCSAFMNWCMRQAGLHGTDSAAAASWLTWGNELREPQHGCVMVIHWKKHPAQSSGNHVTFLDRTVGSRIFDVGGNQGHESAITHSSFSTAMTGSLAFRWPK